MPTLLPQLSAMLQGEEFTRAMLEWAQAFTAEMQMALDAGELGGLSATIFDNQGRVILDSSGIYLYDGDGFNWVSPTLVTIDTQKLADAAVATRNVADQAIGTAQIKDAAIVSALIGDLAVVTAKIADLAVNDAKIADLSVNKLRAGTIGVNQLYLGDTNFHLDGQETNITVTDDNDVLRVRLGRLGLGASDYGIEIYNAAGDPIFAAGAVFGAFAYLDQITGGNISTYIASAAIGSAQIADAAIGSAEIADLAVTQAKIANLAVGAAQIADLAVTNAKIANATITGAKIANATITNAKIGNAAVDTLQIAGQAVIIPASGYTRGPVSTTSAGYYDLVVGITSTGAPISIFCASKWTATAQNSVSGGAEIYRNGSLLFTVSFGSEQADISGDNVTGDGSGSFIIRDTPGAGSHTYTFRAYSGGAINISSNVEYVSLVMMETLR